MKKAPVEYCLKYDNLLDRASRVFSIRGPVREAIAETSERVEATASQGLVAEFGVLAARLEGKVDALLAVVEKQRRTKDWYSTAEVAEELHKAEFTVREWCRLGQCNAQKSKGYRGGKKQWMIPHEEKLRLENEGPAPLGTYRRPSPKY